MNKTILSWLFLGLLWLGINPSIHSHEPGPSPELARVQQLRANSQQVSPELQELSQLITKIQVGLQRFGINEIYIGGGSARAILDHLYFAKPITMRDLDIFVTLGQAVTAPFAQNLATSLEGPELGRYSAIDFGPRPRPNPKLPPPQDLHYNAGYGFYWVKEQGIIDLSIYHTAEDLALNGVFSFDRVMIKLKQDQSLKQVIAEHLSQKNYQQLCQTGIVIDQLDGYYSWVYKQPVIINWYNLQADPAKLSIRIIRTMSKLNIEVLPFTMERQLAQAISASKLSNRLEFLRNILRIMDDQQAARELKMLSQIEGFKLISTRLQNKIMLMPLEQLSQLMKNKASSLDTFIELIADLSLPEQRSLLNDLRPVDGKKIDLALSQLAVRGQCLKSKLKPENYFD